MNMSTRTSSVESTSYRRDPALILWTLAGVGWVVTLLLTFVGGAEAGAHDWVMEQSDWSWTGRILAFLAVWIVMIGAMMLPTTITMARVFTAVSANQPNPTPARITFHAAYLLIWCGFAVVALGGDSRIHWMVDHWAWLADHEALILGSTLILAGAFQFSPLKDACLSFCRSPLGVVMRNYRRGASGGWRVGWRHGLYCLGCCWALMLVMFATGVGSLAWMLLLTAVMVAEKTSRWGSQLVAPVGISLITAGVVVSLPALLS
jgi:predicted metal-binding membrane protein